MNLRKIISKRIRHEEDGVQIAGDVNAVISANVGERRSTSHVSSRQSARVVQRSRRPGETDRANGGAEDSDVEQQSTNEVDNDQST